MEDRKPQEFFTVQTRSELNGINEYLKLSDAFMVAEADETIWKISFSLPTGERVRLVKSYMPLYGRNETCWIYEPIMEEIPT